LNIEKGGFNDLVQLPVLSLKNESRRIQQFYRLALLMHSDAIAQAKRLHRLNKLQYVWVELLPTVLKIEKSPSTTIPTDVIENF
jgi:hypothetical protein